MYMDNYNVNIHNVIQGQLTTTNIHETSYQTFVEILKWYYRTTYMHSDVCGMFKYLSTYQCFTHCYIHNNFQKNCLPQTCYLTPSKFITLYVSFG